MEGLRITDEEIGIIKRAQAGEESAFNALFFKYKEFVEKLLCLYLKDMDEARDLTNVVFIKVHDNLSSFVDYSSFGGWLRIITNHVAIDYLREKKNKAIVIDNFEDFVSSYDTSSSVESRLVNKMLYDEILAEFEKFPETTCKVLKLYYVNNLTAKRISKQLNVPIGTIKSMLSRARSKIKKSLNV